MADLCSTGAAVPGFLWPLPKATPYSLGVPTFATILALNSAARKNGMVGRVIWEDGGTHNISKVCFRTGAVTAGTGSTIQVALQNVKADAGPPGIGDGTDDQTYSTTTMPSANTWTEWTLSSTRSTATGDLLAVIWRLSTFGSSTSVIIQGALTSETNSCHCYYTADDINYIVPNTDPNVVFVSDDATPIYGSLLGATSYSAVNTHTFSNTSDPKIHCLSFTPNVDMVVSGLWAVVGDIVAAEDFSLVLYNSTGTALKTVSVNSYTIKSGIGKLFLAQLPSSYTCVAGTQYLVGVRPDTASTISAYSIDVASAGYLNVIPGGEDCNYTTISAADAVAAATTTRRLLAGVLVTGVATGGGGIITHPGMGGGMRG